MALRPHERLSPRGHHIAAAICLALCLLAILGIVLEGGRLDWNWQAATSFGHRGSPPLWFATMAMSLFATTMAAAAVWQLRLSRR